MKPILFFLTLLSTIAWSATESFPIEFRIEPSPEKLSLHILTEEEKTWLKDNPTVTIGSSVDYAPFDYLDKNELKGISQDYLQLISNKTGITFIIRADLWGNNLNTFKSGQLDLLSSTSYLKERESFALFSKDYFEVIDYIFIRSDLNIASNDDLEGLRVAVPKGYATVELVKQYYPELTIVTVDSFNSAIDALLEKKADVLYEPYLSLSFALTQQGIASIIPFKAARSAGNTKLHFMIAKQKPTLASILDKALQNINDAEHNAVYRKWLRTPDQNLAVDDLFTEEERDWINNNPTIYYGAELDWGPYDFQGPNGEHLGISKDVLNEISTLTTLSFEPVFDEWSQLLKKFETKEIRLLPAIYGTKEREERFLFTQYYQSMLEYVFVRNDIRMDRLSQLNEFTLAMPKGYIHEAAIKEKYPNTTINYVPTINDAIIEVIKGDADAVIEAYAVVDFISRSQGITTLKAAVPFRQDSVRKLRMATLPDEAIFNSILRKSISAIPQKKMIEIHDRWLSDEVRQTDPAYSLTQTERLWLINKPNINIGVLSTGLPFDHMLGTPSKSGIIADYLERIEAFMDIPIHISVFDNKEAIANALHDREIDVSLDFLDNKLKDSSTIYQSGRFVLPNVLIMSDEQTYISDIASVKNRTIGYLPALTTKARIQALPSSNTLIEYSSLDDLLLAVSTHKIDAAVATLNHSTYLINELGLNNLRVVGAFNGETQLAFSSLNDDAVFTGLFEKALTIIDRNDRGLILEQWGTANISPKVDYTLALWLTVVFLAILSVSFYWNRKLKREVDYRTSIQNQLKLAKESAEEATRAKSDFLANMSHEIRTPMNGVLALTHLLKSTPLNEEQDKYVDNIILSGNNLLMIINSILDFSKIEAGKLELEVHEFNLRHLLNNVHDIFEIEANKKGLDFHFDRHSLDFENFQGDSLRLTQVLTNLLSNAIKFTSQGSVSLTINQKQIADDKIQCEFIVKDSGIGIPKSSQSKLFSSFNQVDNSTTRQFGGTGLGLAICKELVQLMAGEIKLESEENKGTTIAVTLTFKPLVKEPISQRDMHPEKRSAITNQGQDALNGLNILVVEDNAVNQLIARNYLTSKGAKIDVAENGEIAIKKISQENYDLVLMDIQMPVLDGCEATTIIRKDFDAKQLPIIALSANVLESDVKHYLSVGMNDHVGKPIDFDVLINKILQHKK